MWSSTGEDVGPREMTVGAPSSSSRRWTSSSFRPADDPRGHHRGLRGLRDQAQGLLCERGHHRNGAQGHLSADDPGFISFTTALVISFNSDSEILQRALAEFESPTFGCSLSACFVLPPQSIDDQPRRHQEHLDCVRRRDHSSSMRKVTGDDVSSVAGLRG